MEVSGMFKGLNITTPTTRRRIFPATLSTGFSDSAHLSYYNSRSRIIASSSSSPSVDGLSSQQDSTFADILAVTQSSVAYAKRMKAANKERRKEEKAKLKASRKKDKAKLKSSRKDDSSSSSSSSDSEGECDMKARRRSGFLATLRPESVVEAGMTVQRVEVCMGGKCQKSGGAALMEDMERRYGQNSVVSCKCMGKCSSAPNARVVFTPETAADLMEQRVEVCMGGKCRKSGGPALMADMERRYGQNAVVPCKCMGKCGSAPNARVVVTPHSSRDSGEKTDSYSCVE